jgi:hypothetical protein
LLVIRAEAKMVNLKSCEILDELKKLGINKPSDAIEYLREYTDYCLSQDENNMSESGKS